MPSSKRELINQLREAIDSMYCEGGMEFEKEMAMLCLSVKPEYREAFKILVDFLEDPGDDFWQYHDSDPECQIALKSAFRLAAKYFEKVAELAEQIYS